MPLLGLRVRQVDPGDVPDGRVGVLPGQDGVLLHGHGQLLARGVHVQVPGASAGGDGGLR